MELSKEILDVITKQLPGIHADAMKSFITEAEVTKKELGITRGKLEDAQKELSTTKAELGKLQADRATADRILKDAEKVEHEKTQLTLDRLKFDVTKEIADIKVAEATKRADSIYTLVGLFVRNTDVSKIVNASSHMNTQTGTFWNNNHEERYVIGESTIQDSTETEVRSKLEPPKPGDI